MMLDQINVSGILFLDVETVPMSPSYGALPESFKKLWEQKSSQFRSPEQSAEDVYERAGIYAEFGKIICISCGFIHGTGAFEKFRVKSFYGDQEKSILETFSDTLARFSATHKDANLCAHNGKEFDFPYLARRYVINGLKIPEMLQIAGKKPWEVKLLDTMELWKFGDYKHYTSLKLLAVLFDIPSPKDDMDGSMVSSVYYEDQGLPRIVEYCEKDVLTLVQVFRRFRGERPLQPEQVEMVE